MSATSEQTQPTSGPTIAELRAAVERRGWTVTDYNADGRWIILLPPNWGDVPLEHEPMQPVFGHGTNERHALADALDTIDFCGMTVSFPEQEPMNA